MEQRREQDPVQFTSYLDPQPGASLYFVLHQCGDTMDPHGSWRLNKTVAMVKFVWYFGTN